jgi:hypothetical protein
LCGLHCCLNIAAHINNMLENLVDNKSFTLVKSCFIIRFYNMFSYVVCTHLYFNLHYIVSPTDFGVWCQH